VRLAADFDSEEPAHRAVKAVAADQIAGAHRLRATGLPIKQRCRHPVAVLDEIRQLHAVPDRDVRKRAGMVLQDRVEPGLRARHAALGADRQMRQVLQRRNADAAELVTLHVGDEHAV
jgi:hypothetical protein